jgi:ABC-type nitrate/sulfonate/bicarbonate transport system ATPase subunit
VAAVKVEVTVDLKAKSFRGPDGALRTVVHDVAFRMRPGEFVAIVGPSGCGKTTLLNIVAGLDADFTGSVSLGEQAPSTARIGYVFQNPRLLPWRTVYENITLVLPGAADRTAILRLLEEVGLADAGNVFSSRLSLGMARRAAIARAFAIEPELLLMDEPFASLDEATAERLRRVLGTLWRSRPTGVLFVTHDLHEAVELADRILLLSDAPGRLLADVPVPLPRERRADRAALDAARAEIRLHHRALLAGASFPEDEARAAASRP